MFLQDNVDCSLEYDDRTPLHIAAANGDLNMVQKLLEHGASVHKVDKYGATPLLDAIRFKRKDVIRHVYFYIFALVNVLSGNGVKYSVRHIIADCHLMG